MKILIDENQNNKNCMIILIDSTTSLHDLKQFMTDNPGSVIISFDYDSHKILTDNLIAHEISDNYLTKIDLEKIHEQSFILSRWYENPSLSGLLDYDGINTGKLFYVEFHYFLNPFLKKFVELSNIFKKHPNTKFVASVNLYKIAKPMSAFVSVLEEKYDDLNSFLYDSINIRLTNSLNIKISNDYYLKLKNIIDEIVSLLIKSKKSLTHSKSVLLVEFNPIRYEKLFIFSTKYSLDLLLYNRRRPAVWNLKSYAIIRKSNCILVKQKISNTKIDDSIEKAQYLMKTRINSLRDQKELLSSYFSFNGNSFWEILQPFFFDMCMRRITEAVREIEVVKELFSTSKISSILIWTENGFSEQIVISLAKKFKIPIILIQHGLYDDAISSYEINKFMGVLPIDSDKFIGWGNVMGKYMINSNISPEKIKILGSPMYDKIFERKNQYQNKKNFILLALPSLNNALSDFTVKTMENYEKAILKICEITSNLNKELIIKMHPFQGEPDISSIIKKTKSKIKILRGNDILPLIENCEIFLVIDASTTILEAQVLGKPVISIAVTDDSKDAQVFKSNSCIRSNLDDLENHMKNILEDESFKKKIIDNGNNFVTDYLTNPGTSSKAFLSFLEKL